jgi:hypothetical protein
LHPELSLSLKAFLPYHFLPGAGSSVAMGTDNAHIFNFYEKP